MPTTIRSLTLAVPSQDRAEALELLRRRVRDFDAPAAIVADDRHARHERTLQRALECRELHRARAWLAASRPLLLHVRLGVAHRPRVRDDPVSQLQLLIGAGQGEQR